MGVALDTLYEQHKMATCVSKTSSYSSHSHITSDVSVSSELDELLYSSMNMTEKDRVRLAREFYSPAHIALSGNYYPRYKVTGGSITGTAHISYLSRPMYSYLVPSRYSGYSKYVYINKI